MVDLRGTGTHVLDGEPNPIFCQTRSGSGISYRGANPRGGANLLIDIIFAENCMKMKTNVTEGGRG